jgi:four helix bundle protein
MSDTDFKVLNKAKELASLTIQFISKEEFEIYKYTLNPQIIKAAVSIPSNIAEGNERGKKEFLHFINIARGSLKELKIQLEILNDICIINDSYYDQIFNLIDEVGKMTHGLKNQIKTILMSESED